MNAAQFTDVARTAVLSRFPSTEARAVGAALAQLVKAGLLTTDTTEHNTRIKSGTFQQGGAR